MITDSATKQLVDYLSIRLGSVRGHLVEAERILRRILRRSEEDAEAENPLLENVCKALKELDKVRDVVAIFELTRAGPAFQLFAGHARSEASAANDIRGEREERSIRATPTEHIPPLDSSDPLAGGVGVRRRNYVRKVAPIEQIPPIPLKKKRVR
ncbi:MAG: hypothetical protein ABIH23_08425 [bacterium]